MDSVAPRPVRRRHRGAGGWTAPSEPAPDDVAVEEPLEIRVEGAPLVVLMRTPGADLDLAAGFLYTEGVVDGADDIRAMAHSAGDPQGNTVDVLLAAGVEAHRAQLDRATRERFASSACGVCGTASIDRLLVGGVRRAARLEPDPELLAAGMAALTAAQAGFARTGGLHAAALLGPDGTLDVVREDIGRHNAVDKVLGWRLRADRVPVDDRILLVSSRAGYEIVQKALAARIPCVAAIGAASSLAVDLARAANVALVAFLRPDRLNMY